MKRSSICGSLALVVTVLCVTPLASAQGQSVPANVAAALLVKLVAFEKNLSTSSDLSIYVVGAPEVAAELKKGIGKPIGKTTLARVDAGSGLPSSKPSVLFVGDPGQFDAAVAYTRSNKVLSVTGSPDLVARGITLGFGIGDDSKPKILLNLKSSVDEGADWNPAIMKVAQTIN